MVRLLLFLSLFILTAAGCGSGGGDASTSAAMEAPASGAPEVESAPARSEEAPETAAPPAPSGASPQAAVDANPQRPLLIYTASLTLEVDNPAVARDSALAIASRLGGYSSNESQQQLGNREVLEITLRVPATQFQTLLGQLERSARRVEDRVITAEDITQEFTDNEARLRTRRATEAQYLELLKRAGKISEVLEVQQQLAQVREEIEVVEGRQRYFRNQMRYSTIRVQFFRLGETPLYAQPSFLTRLGDSIRGGWEGLQALVIGVVALWPFWLILGLGWWLWRRYRRQNPPTKQTSASGPPAA